MHLNLSGHKDIDALYKALQRIRAMPFSGFEFQNFLENKSIEQDKLQNVWILFNYTPLIGTFCADPY